MEMKSRLLQILFAMIVLFAIGVPVAEAGLFGSSWADDRDKATACFSAIYRDQQFKILPLKLAIDSEPTLDQLADESLPTESKVQIIRAGAERMRPCREMMPAAYREHHLHLTSSLELRYFQNDLVFVQLLQRRITYGNAARLLQQAWLEHRARQDAYNQARSDEQRRALSESTRDLSRQFQSSPQPSGSGRMTCRWVGPTLYCDSY